MSLVGYGNQHQGFNPNKLIAESAFFEYNQQFALERLMQAKYNQIHEDAFNKICGFEEIKKRPWNSRARDLIGGLWFERNLHKIIMRTQDFEYSKLLKENQELRTKIEKMRNTKGDYGSV